MRHILIKGVKNDFEEFKIKKVSRRDTFLLNTVLIEDPKIGGDQQGQPDGAGQNQEKDG